jgi:metal-sulfur cluster biosynthetic enzyme
VTVVLPISPRLDAGLPFAVTSHKSGGRDVWTGPLTEAPADPEIPISLVELGLIYGVDLEAGVARITITFTATACPCMEFIREDIMDRLEVEAWIDAVEIEEVWSPSWTNQMITEEGRRKLKSYGVGA